MATLDQIKTDGTAQAIGQVAAVAGTAVAGLQPVLVGGQDGGGLLATLRTCTAALLATLSGVGAALVTRPGEWSLGQSQIAATQAMVTKAAGGAGVRHVCTSISATLATGATAQATQVNLQLLDNNGGTVVWSKGVILPANSVWEVNLSGLNIVGLPNSSMVLRFDTAGVAGSFESLAMTGYDVA